MAGGVDAHSLRQETVIRFFSILALAQDMALMLSSMSD